MIALLALQSSATVRREAERSHMASLTIRQLDDDTKKRLRLRAAANNRSMEDEARVILRGAAAGTVEPARRQEATERRIAPRETAAAKPVPPARLRVLLIIGGGIAAYKSLDLIRRLQDRGASVRCILTAAAQEFITP